MIQVLQMEPSAKNANVEVRREVVVLPTYEPNAPDRNPMFLEKRVYQGSSGRVYPLPFTDRIAERPRPREWEAVYIENDYIQVMVLPALGGRIHRAIDKTNGYDFIYYQPVIKPALVGLAGPWASGGIEFNWPQHHRPSTFMPVDVAVEEHPDGAMTVWLSEHDPMARMKGMHGVRLHPGRSYLELVARVYNRTSDVQTFLWWANVAARAHEQYQSFFPPDVAFVADHAKRAVSTFPLCDGSYYGVDYAARAKHGTPALESPRQFAPLNRTSGSPATAGPAPNYPPNDLSWYANIPVPTSYMCLGSAEDFSGGYDHKARAGLVHIADRHISPGKKQWTWGNSEFGYAWDRNLTDPDENGEYRPYVELMGGVYTDNQPDFSFLQPGETRTWSQFWYPIRNIGPAQKANVDAALSFKVVRGVAHVGIAVTRHHQCAVVRLRNRGTVAGEWIQTIAPDQPLVFQAPVAKGAKQDDFTVQVLTDSGSELVAYAPAASHAPEPPAAATEPGAPAAIGSCDELFVIGLHLEQYRHATRLPEIYWREALRRDPADSRCNLAMGRWHLRRGELDDAERHLRSSISRLVTRNSNPYDGEPYYQLGRCLRYQAFGSSVDMAKLGLAYDAYFKATWNQAWQAAAFLALAEIDAARHDWVLALEHLDKGLRLGADNLRARNLKVVVLRRLFRADEADCLLRETLALDPLDWWARHLTGQPLACDAQVRLDISLDYAGAGLFREALDAISQDPQRKRPFVRNSKRAVDLPDASLGTLPLVLYYRAWLSQLAGDRAGARRLLRSASRANPDYCFPSRLEEIAILNHAMESNPTDARAPFYLGNLLYDRRRHLEALRLWEKATKLDPGNAVAWRNLGIGYFNVLNDADRALAAYDRAFAANTGDGRLLYERDQLWKRVGVAPSKRLAQLRKYPRHVHARDDLSVEFCALLNQTGAPQEAMGLLARRKFQPWEGGEGLALRQHVRTHIAMGRRALKSGDASTAVRYFHGALSAPENLGEASHPLANRSDALYWLGRAFAESGDTSKARATWEKAAGARGDFQAMRVTSFSEMTYYSARSLECLGRRADAKGIFRDLLAYSKELFCTPGKIDYFATSLPTMLLFDDDLTQRQKTAAIFLEAQAKIGLGKIAAGRKLLREVLLRDPSHAFAADQPD
jgi:tetratricopeptide (TPR) repeat protein